MTRIVRVVLVFLFLSGCTHIPFQETKQVVLESVDPLQVVGQFRGHMADSFQILNSVVFEYSWQSFMGIGYVSVDRQQGTFNVSCLNPLGVRLFELSGDAEKIDVHQVLPALMEYGDLPTAVGTDIRRIYFDLVPSDKARSRTSTYTVNFTQPYGSGTMEYEFSGQDRDLTTKTYSEDNEEIWRISYYEYREQNGKRYPHGIIMINFKYGYQLTVRQKELFS